MLRRLTPALLFATLGCLLAMPAAATAATTAPATVGASANAPAGALDTWCAYRVSGRDGSAGLNVRQGPGLNHRVIGSLPVGTRVYGQEHTRQADGYTWRLISGGGLDGWAADKWLDEIPNTCMG